MSGWIHGNKKKIIKRKLWFRSNKRCFYCQAPMVFMAATIDHMKPRSAGGTNRLSNLVLACAPCNHAKGNHEHALPNPRRRQNSNQSLCG